MSSVSSPILQAYASEPAVHALLDACVGRLARRDGNVFELDDGTLYHIADWLRAALINNEPWLKNVDAHGRPKKLLKFGSVDAIVQEADKAMIKAAQKICGGKLTAGDEELVETLQDGYYVVRLLTPAALDHESAEMQHCIGNGGYDKRLNDGCHTYLSLRDPAGRPHVTIEVTNGCLTQFQGKQNALPTGKYRDLLAPFVKSRKWWINNPATHLDHVIDEQGNWHSIHSLPQGLRINGDLNLRETTVKSLPNDMRVDGYLYLSHTNILELPTGLSVGSHLDLYGTAITNIPADLDVGGDLFLNHTLITSLPEGLSVGGSLDVEYTNVSALPNRLSVGGIILPTRLVPSPLTRIKRVCLNLYVGGARRAASLLRVLSSTSSRYAASVANTRKGQI